LNFLFFRFNLDITHSESGVFSFKTKAMYFTKAQMRGLWFIIFSLGASVLYHYVNVLLFNNSQYDFREFEKSFYKRRDSIQALKSFDTTTTLKISKEIDEKREFILANEFPININHASSLELQKLPRIGPKMAARIILFREKNGPFKSKDEIMRVKGIGNKTFERLKELIIVQ